MKLVSNNVQYELFIFILDDLYYYGYCVYILFFIELLPLEHLIYAILKRNRFDVTFIPDISFGWGLGPTLGNTMQSTR